MSNTGALALRGGSRWGDNSFSTSLAKTPTCSVNGYLLRGGEDARDLLDIRDRIGSMPAALAPVPGLPYNPTEPPKGEDTTLLRNLV